MSGQFDVIIIGAGPSGLAAARSLLEQGIKNVLLIERESEAGGVPRHCRHPTFGLLTYFRPMKGHQWASRNLDYVQGKYEIRTNTTVINIKPAGEIDISSNLGHETLRGKRIIIATGVRETPRHARLVSGLRPQGVLTTGALQQFIYLRKLKPGLQPVIVGSELVSFSAIWTLRHAGIKALALIDEHTRPIAFRPSTIFARLMGVKLHLGAHVTNINGDKRVESIEFQDNTGKKHLLPCDSIIFSGKFIGEYTLIRNSHLLYEAASGRPIFDQHGKCSDPCYFVTGNMTHPADMGDQCYQEGLRVGRFVAQSLIISEQPGFTIPITLENIFRISAPNIITCTEKTSMKITLNVRVNQEYTGDVVVYSGERELYRKRHRCMPERRVLLKGIDVSGMTSGDVLMIKTQ